MKIAHLTSVHPRYDTRVFLKECRSLAAAGHGVTLVVADGKGDEHRDHVTITDVGKPQSRLGRMLYTVNAVYCAAAALDADLYHLHDPELLRIARKLRRLSGGKFVVFDAHEDVPRQILSKLWIPTPFRRLIAFGIGLIENRTARKLSGIVVANPPLVERFHVLNAHTVNVCNYPIPDELISASSLSVKKRQICYVGGITRSRGIEMLVRALPLIPDVTLALCGAFQEREFEAKVRVLSGWSQVDYRGHVDRDGVRRVLSESMVGMATLLPTPAYPYQLPVKMFEYMAAELPVIVSNFPLWQRVVDGAGAGVCVNPQSPKTIATAIRELVDDPAKVERMGKAGRKAVLERYNWPNEAKKLIEFYQELA